MKKILSFVLLIVLSAILISCGNSEVTEQPQTPTTTEGDNHPSNPTDSDSVPSNSTDDNHNSELETAINEAVIKLDAFAASLMDKIPFESVKTATKNLYETEKEKIYNATSIESIASYIADIKDKVSKYSIDEAKKIAISNLQEVINAGLGKMPNQEIKTDLENFANKEIEKINSIDNIEDIPSTLANVIEETEEHIKTLLVSTVKGYLAKLTEAQTSTAYDYIPATMHPSYSANLVNPNNLVTDFTSNVNVSSISKNGFGEQWQMVVENINQTLTMTKIFNVSQTALNACGNAIDIYLDNSYSDEMSYTFSGEGYDASFEYKNNKLIVNMNLTTSVSIVGLGQFNPTIKMEYDLEDNTKSIFITLNDSCKVKYVVSDNFYEMATTYGITVAGKVASRSTYLSIEKNNLEAVGHIYEYTTYEGSDKIQASVDFYITNDYVSVVGNKASGMMVFDGYVSELYSAATGRLLGYEVREELTILGVTGTYNTLWFNVWDINGINSIKVTDKTSSNKSDKSVVDVYLNGSNTLLSPTYNKKALLSTSRKYDVELRTHFYYTYDEAKDEYVAIEVMVPMFFIQEGDNFDSFESDFINDNKFEASVGLNTVYLNKILSDYDTLIDIFIENKNNISSEAINNYLK